MVRGWSAILGIGLVILWIAGLSSATAPAWLTWLDAAAAVWAFIIAAGTPVDARTAMRAGNPIALSIGLFAFWIIGLATSGPAWQDWWNFAFACAFLVLGFAGGMAGRRAVPTSTVTPSEEERRFRRRA
jgi:hypothetical protein